MTSDTTVNHGIGGNLGQVAGRSDGGKSIVHTMDPQFILGIARVSEFGARKYHMRNFLMAPGMSWGSVYGSLMRHLLLWWDGEELDLGPNGEYGETDDPETNMKWSGLPHLHHVAWNVMVLCTYSMREPFKPGDDRPSTLEYQFGSWRDWDGAFKEIQANLTAKTETAQIEKDRGEKLEVDPAFASIATRAIGAHEIVDEARKKLEAIGYAGTVQYEPNSHTITIKL